MPNLKRNVCLEFIRLWSRSLLDFSAHISVVSGSVAAVMLCPVKENGSVVISFPHLVM